MVIEFEIVTSLHPRIIGPDLCATPEGRGLYQVYVLISSDWIFRLKHDYGNEFASSYHRRVKPCPSGKVNECSKPHIIGFRVILIVLNIYNFRNTKRRGYLIYHWSFR